MEVDPDAGRLYVFLGGLLLFGLLETVFRQRPWGRPRWQRAAFHGAIALLNTTIIRALLYVPLLLWIVQVEQQGWGLSRWLGLTGWTELIASVVVLDAFDYLWHRANHRVPLLWRFHKAHHADTAVDVTTSLRFHPGELLISGLAKALWVVIWGPTATAWFLFEALVSLCSQFHHANFRFPPRVDRLLSKVLVTPTFHATHHAVERQWGDRNFSTILSIWDPLLRTAVDPAAGPAPLAEADALGLPERRERAFGPVAWLLEPLRPANLGLARDREPAAGPAP